MDNLPLYMTSHLNDIPEYPLPDGFTFCLLSHEQEKEQWAEITTAAGEFTDKQHALQRFATEFAPKLNEVKRRIVFLKTTHDTYVGTATAWFGQWKNQTIGRLHWIAIKPAFQGKGLGKPLVAKAVKLLKQYHHKAYLKTQPRNLTAIYIYRDFGFKPAIHSAAEEQAWNAVFSRLRSTDKRT
ncbi:MAG TPA: GNAT family N-acetyltransferase [Bacillota bacterium]|nr:GNAT family N-acetyltransferase [Bacillota bacterium]